MKLFVQADADKRFPVKGDVKLELPARNTLQTCPFHAFPSVSMLKVLRAVCLLCIDVAKREARRGRRVSRAGLLSPKTCRDQNLQA